MDWIRERRESLGMKSQGDLANRLQLEGINVTRASVSHWENGRHRPPFDDPDFLKAFARILRLPENEILHLSGYNVLQIHSENAERAAYLMDQMAEDKQQLALKMLELFAEEG